MLRKRKRYTQEELDKIKELYMQGYSASLILEKICRVTPEDYSSFNANSWLYRMRKRLGLPKRGIGFRGIRRPNPRQIQAQIKAQKKMLERLQKIPLIIERYEKLITKLKEEQEKLRKILENIQEKGEKTG